MGKIRFTDSDGISEFTNALSSITGQMRPVEARKMGFDYLQGTSKFY